ncbi:MAG TPA: isocitrate lyase/phosphoenolpyruvate mutase family protein [Gemmatimonadaceae bacterium]|nr:isocitrate lyase/phosphoenolpyruvate mutase family protein [Gemmatimonadaceae bacterium]
MQTLEARQRAAAFRRLHAEPEPLILVNAWDAGSARVLEQTGAPAIATTSAGMAWSLGYSDGEQVPTGEFVAATARICRAVSVPVTVDIERGFGQSTDDVVAFVRTLIGLGVVGVNIEDGVLPDTHQLATPDVLSERIQALREMATQMNASLFINARTDTYFVANDDRVARYSETVRRAQLYASAGADGIFVPGMDLDDAFPFARAVTLPVNLYAGGGGAPPVHVLRRAGVRRISLGCGPLQSVFGSLRTIAKEAFADGSYDAMNGHMLPFGDVNGLFATSAPSTPEA